jgi:protein O-mannosyl-transferase
VRNRSGQWQEVEQFSCRTNYYSRAQKCQAFLREKQTLSAPQNRIQKTAMSRPRLIALLLALATLLVYLPVTRDGFIDCDDDDYVTNNQVVQNGLTLAGLQWAFTTGHASNWHPLTWLSHMTDCELFGLNPAAHHFVNVLFHAANTALLFMLLLRLTGLRRDVAASSAQAGALWPAAFIAALFAWHPLHVESVAWIAERKDLLSTFFALLALLSYTRYVKENCRRSFWFALIFSALGLMSKPMLVTLPFVMLLLDYWPLQRFQNFQIPTIRRLALEKWPFFLLSIISCIVTFLAQRSTAVVSLELVPLGFRLENIPVAYVAYLSKIVWPANLAVIYPLPADSQLPTLTVALAVTVLIFICAAVWLARKRAPYLSVGWLWFLGTLVPVIGLVQVGGQAYADRYTYLPAIGLFIMAAFGACDLTRRFQLPKIVVAGTTALILAACLVVTENQLRYWQDSEALFRHALAVTKDNHIAYVNLGVAFELNGKPNEALVEYRAAEQLAPGHYNVHNNIGNRLDNLGRPEEALAEYQKAIFLNPTMAVLHNSAGVVLTELARFNEAMIEFTNAMRLDPAYPMPHVKLGDALLKQGRDAEAIQQFNEAMRLDPLNFAILTRTAHVLASISNPQVRDGKTALALATKANDKTGGGQAIVLNALGMALAETGDFTNAIAITQQALDLADAAHLEKLEALQNQLHQELQLYQNHQPWRESFLATNMPSELLQKN